MYINESLSNQYNNKNFYQNVKNLLNSHEKSGLHGMDMSLCKINFKNKTFDFSGARNPLVKVSNGEIEVFIADKKSIGESYRKRKKVTEEKKFTKRTLSFEEKSTFYIFSDGYVDQLGGENQEKYLSYNLYELIKDIDKKSIKEKGNILEEKHNNWKGNEEQLDDIVVVGFTL